MCQQLWEFSYHPFDKLKESCLVIPQSEHPINQICILSSICYLKYLEGEDQALQGQVSGLQRAICHGAWHGN
jgi:hypothetical protein